MNANTLAKIGAVAYVPCILDWRVADVGDVNGALIQLTQDGPNSH